MERNGEIFEMMRRKKQWDLETGMGGLTEQKGAKNNRVGILRENITDRCLLVIIIYLF